MRRTRSATFAMSIIELRSLLHSMNVSLRLLPGMNSVAEAMFGESGRTADDCNWTFDLGKGVLCEALHKTFYEGSLANTWRAYDSYDDWWWRILRSSVDERNMKTSLVLFSLPSTEAVCAPARARSKSLFVEPRLLWLFSFLFRRSMRFLWLRVHAQSRVTVTGHVSRVCHSWTAKSTR